MRFQGGQQLPNFGGNGDVVEQQAPLRSINRAGFYAGTQARRQQRLYALETGARFAGQLAQTFLA